MTTYGPPEYYRCKTCSKHLYVHPLTSCNNFGRIGQFEHPDFISIRSDGYDFHASYQSDPPLVACRHCEAVFQLLGSNPAGRGKDWIPGRNLPEKYLRKKENVPKIDDETEESFEMASNHFDDATHYVTASVDACLKYVNEHAIEARYEAAIRVYVWQMANSKRKGISPESMSDLERKNLEALIDCLKSSDRPRDVLVRAEGLRELGQFDRAAALLNRDFTGTDAAFAIEILGATLQNDSNLCHVYLRRGSDTDSYTNRWIQMREAFEGFSSSGSQ
jgi:hypothetical protein